MNLKWLHDYPYSLSYLGCDPMLKEETLANIFWTTPLYQCSHSLFPFSSSPSSGGSRQANQKLQQNVPGAVI